MQEGGYKWEDLVIFLRATHDELVKAGFKHLDPKHELFLTYRPEDNGGEDEAVAETVLQSPRGMLLSPRPLPRPATSRSPSRRSSCARAWGCAPRWWASSSRARSCASSL